MRLSKTPMIGKALCIFHDMALLCYKSGKLYLYDTQSYEVINVFSLPQSRLRSLLCRCRLVERALHNEVRWAVPIGERKALIASNMGILLLDCDTGMYSTEKVSVQGKPLFASCIHNINGFENSVVIGDYSSNKMRTKVSLYQRREDGEWRCAYTFPAGSVRHIHGVFADEKAHRVYVLTGDEDSESGIWLAEDNFNRVTPVLIGSQQYRACQMLAYDNQVLFMTDAPSEKNAIYKINDAQADKIADLAGSCIYGAIANGSGIFSTTCEPDAHAKNRFEYWLTNRPGMGIGGRTISVFTLKDNGEKQEITQFVHDGLPLRLFQYGTVTFSNSRNGIVYFTPQCVQRDAECIFRVDFE